MTADEAGAAPWREDLTASPLLAGRSEPSGDEPRYTTLTYEVDGRVARITFDRAEKGNSIVPETPVELAHAVERADVDPRVHVILVSGRGKGFCGGYDLGAFAESQFDTGAPDPGGEGATTVGARAVAEQAGTVLDPAVQAANHDPARTWDPMLDYAMMSRYTRGWASLLHADKPTVVKAHGFCVAGGSDIALHADQLVMADDCLVGYPPTRVWGVPSAGLWAHRLGDARAKRLLLTGDTLTGRQAVEWGLAVEAWPAEELDERTEALVARIAAQPVNQLMMVKLALNSSLLASGVATSRMVSTVFDGVSRHTAEGYSFARRSADVGWRQAVAERDEPFGDPRARR